MTADQLKDAERWAFLLFPLPKIALLLGIPLAEIEVAMESADDPLKDAINRGYLLCEAELRQAGLDWAKRGSTPALQMANDWLKQVVR